MESFDPETSFFLSGTKEIPINSCQLNIQMDKPESL